MEPTKLIFNSLATILDFEKNGVRVDESAPIINAKALIGSAFKMLLFILSYRYQ